jgi:hypothetical protein
LVEPNVPFLKMVTSFWLLSLAVVTPKATALPPASPTALLFVCRQSVDSLAQIRESSLGWRGSDACSPGKTMDAYLIKQCPDTRERRPQAERRSDSCMVAEGMTGVLWIGLRMREDDRKPHGKMTTENVYTQRTHRQTCAAQQLQGKEWNRERGREERTDGEEAESRTGPPRGRARRLGHDLYTSLAEQGGGRSPSITCWCREDETI